jgi:hypothetical protein
MSSLRATVCMTISMLLIACGRQGSSGSNPYDAQGAAAQLTKPAYPVEFSDMPSSKYDTVVAGLNQRDVSERFYNALPFLPSGLRFFAVYEATLGGGTFLMVKPSTIFFVAQPNNEVNQFVDARDLVKLHIKLRSPEDALALVRFLSGYGELGFFLQDTPYFRMKIEGNEVLEIPDNGSCIGYSPGPLKAAGIAPPSVEVVSDSETEKHFVVTRFMVPRFPTVFDHRGGELPSVIKIREHVTLNGSYSMVSESITTPGFKVTTCAIL